MFSEQSAKKIGPFVVFIAKGVLPHSIYLIGPEHFSTFRHGIQIQRKIFDKVGDRSTSSRTYLPKHSNVFGRHAKCELTFFLTLFTLTLRIVRSLSVHTAKDSTYKSIFDTYRFTLHDRSKETPTMQTPYCFKLKTIETKDKNNMPIYVGKIMYYPFIISPLGKALWWINITSNHATQLTPKPYLCNPTKCRRFTNDPTGPYTRYAKSRPEGA